MGVPDIVKMAARSVGLSSAICRNAASRTRGRSPGARWTSSNRYATKRSGTATAWPFASPGETGLPGVALAMSGGLPPVFSIEKREISCGLPLSKSWKLALVRLSTATPRISRTTTGTMTRVTCDLKAGAVSSRVFISGALGLAGACGGGNGGAGGGTVCARTVADSRHTTKSGRFMVHPDWHELAVVATEAPEVAQSVPAPLPTVGIPRKAAGSWYIQIGTFRGYAHEFQAGATVLQHLSEQDQRGSTDGRGDAPAPVM